MTKSIERHLLDAHIIVVNFKENIFDLVNRIIYKCELNKLFF